MKKFIALVLCLTIEAGLLCACSSNGSAERSQDQRESIEETSSQDEDGAQITTGDPESAPDETTAAGLDQAQVGDIITFGHFEQDNDTSNGTEEIEWIVLDTSENGLLLISVSLLDIQKYNQVHQDVTWETCSIRQWLNDDFYNTAFTAEEQQRIQLTTVVNSDNPYYGADGGNDTEDKIFILSIDEVQTYFGCGEEYSRDDGAIYGFDTTSENALSWVTDYVDGQKELIDDFGRGAWWLRTPGSFTYNATYVAETGFVYTPGSNVGYNAYGIRPVLWLDIAS